MKLPNNNFLTEIQPTIRLRMVGLLLILLLMSKVPGVAPSQVTVKIVNIVKIHAYRGQYGIF